ncbi:MAG: cob(I)yrinic acid a,c-diamide adenosyltransferase [Candidatus Omnitrophota bacterium]
MPKRKEGTRSIVTKKGDQGFSYLLSGKRVSKDSPILETFGDVDELSSILAVARCQMTKTEYQKDLFDIQRVLGMACAELAATSSHVHKLKKRINERMAKALEKKCHALEARNKKWKCFVTPGSSLCSAYLDHARTVARRCERKIVTLAKCKLVTNPHLLVWFNRLSDYLYLLSRSQDKNPKKL